MTCISVLLSSFVCFSEWSQERGNQTEIKLFCGVYLHNIRFNSFRTVYDAHHVC